MAVRGQRMRVKDTSPKVELLLKPCRGERLAQSDSPKASLFNRGDQMTPTQVALAQLHVATVQAWVTGLAIFLGPLVAVAITLRYQSWKDKRDARQRLFLTLMAERKGVMPTYQVTQALNTIDVVFAGKPRVLRRWHSYYTLLDQPTVGASQTHAWLDLLSEMARELGYKDLQQTDLDKFYLPKGHLDWHEVQMKTALEWIRVLENTSHFLAEGLKVKPPEASKASTAGEPASEPAESAPQH